MNATVSRCLTLFRYGLTCAIAPFALCVAPASAAQLAYVPVAGGINVINTATHATTGIALASGPSEMAITPNGQFAYVTELGASGSAGAVAVIATATNTVTANITVGDTPAGIAVSPDGKSVYVANSHGNSISVIATGANSVVATIPVDAAPVAVAFTLDGSSAWVTNQNSNSVSVIDTATNTVVHTISVGNFKPHYLVMSPDGAVVFVSTDDGDIYVMRTATRDIVASIPVSGHTTGLAVTPDGSRLYIDLAKPDGTWSISVISTVTYTAAATDIPENPGDAPGELAFSPDGWFAYVSNFGAGTVSVLSKAANTIVSTIPLEVANPEAHPAAPVFGPAPGLVSILALVSLQPAQVAGGASVAGYVVLTTAAPAGGVIVRLSSSNAAAVVPASVFVPAGSKTAAFSVMTHAVASATSANITAICNGFAKFATLAITPSVALTLSSVSVNQTNIPGGASATGTVTLTAPAPAGGAFISLWTNGAPAFVPASVTVPAGFTTATFPVTTNYTATTMADTITAFLNPDSAIAVISVTAPPALASVSVNPASLPGSESATGTATLREPAPPGGAVVYLWTNGSPAFVPVSVTVPAGSKTVTFPVTTNYTATTLAGTITAFLGGTSTTTTITVMPPPALASISISPSSVQGPNPATGTVTLTTPAPTGGTVVCLWTTGSPAFVPVSVTVPAGSTTAAFPVTTNYTATPVADTITAFLNGQIATTTITVTP